LLRDAENGKFQAALVTAVDRLGRDPEVLRGTARQLETLAVDVRSMAESWLGSRL
jgi:DNA invertase Pin-like site-specific DNA recombinase